MTTENRVSPISLLPAIELLELWLQARVRANRGDAEKLCQRLLMEKHGIFIARAIDPNIDVAEVEKRLWKQ